jgi:hypothetical protein
VAAVAEAPVAAPATVVAALAVAPQIPVGEEGTSQRVGWQDRADQAMGVVNGIISAVFFFDLMFWNPDVTLPLVVAWLVLAAIFLTFRMGFINIRAFTHAIQVTRGRYTDPSEPGEVSHFQALTTALSATVGLGNIAGVAIAVSIGGPGATFWMIVAGLLGMSTKFTECTLAQAYRDVGPSGNVLGGPMQYLSKGLAEKGMGGLGRVLAVLFAFLSVTERGAGKSPRPGGAQLGLRPGADRLGRHRHHRWASPNRQRDGQDRAGHGGGLRHRGPHRDPGEHRQRAGSPGVHR